MRFTGVLHRNRISLAQSSVRPKPSLRRLVLMHQFPYLNYSHRPRSRTRVSHPIEGGSHRKMPLSLKSAILRPVPGLPSVELGKEGWMLSADEPEAPRNRFVLPRHQLPLLRRFGPRAGCGVNRAQLVGYESGVVRSPVSSGGFLCLQCRLQTHSAQVCGPREPNPGLAPKDRTEDLAAADRVWNRFAESIGISRRCPRFGTDSTCNYSCHISGKGSIARSYRLDGWGG